MGALFCWLKVLPLPEVVEVTAAHLTSKFANETVPKTREVLKSAVGKVLFIDEARRP